MTRSAPLYKRIAADLRAEISQGSEGTLPPDAQLPTETELSAQYSTTRSTVRQAIGVLVGEGLVRPDRPRGYFVRGKNPPMIYRPQAEFRRRPATVQMDSFMAQMAQEGRTSSQEIHVELTKPPAVVAQRLRSAETVVVRRRVRYVDGEPYHTNDSYYPARLVAGSEIAEPGDIARGANMVLTELGYEQVRMANQYRSRMPTPEEMTRLDLLPGTPVIEHIRTGYTLQGEPVRCVINILNGDKHIIVTEDRATPLAGASIIIRPGTTEGDVETAVQILQEVRAWLRDQGSDQWQDKEPSTERMASAAETHTLFMVESGGHVIGTLTVDERADPEFWTQEDEPESALYVHRLAVRRAVSGNEVGSSLLDWASKRAAAQGKRRIRLDAWRTNDRLHQYYIERGWQLVRTVTLDHRGSGALFEREAGSVYGMGPAVCEVNGNEERAFAFYSDEETFGARERD